MRKIIRELRKEFGPDVIIETTGRNHYRLLLPSGKSVVVSNTPSYPFYLRHVKRDVRRAITSRRPG